jgi:hypothetical protein
MKAVLIKKGYYNVMTLTEGIKLDNLTLKQQIISFER